MAYERPRNDRIIRRMSAKGGKQGRKQKIASEIEMARWMGGMETEMKYRATTADVERAIGDLKASMEQAIGDLRDRIDTKMSSHSRWVFTTALSAIGITLTAILTVVSMLFG